jgi:adenosylhomocysteine nucleosidase
LNEELTPGCAYRVAGVIDARSGERFETECVQSRMSVEDSHPSRKNNDAARVGHPDLWLVTSPRVADAEEKQRLASTCQAALVDMEAAAIARLARMRGIPFYCGKGISDGYSDQLPDFNRFISSGGHLRLISLVAFVLLRPWYWRALMRMGENSKKAAHGIAQLVLGIVDEEGILRKHHGYPDCTCRK